MVIFVQVVGSGVIETSNETNPGTHRYNQKVNNKQ